MIIEKHSHEKDPVTITEHCVSVSITDSTRPPYTSISLVMSLKRHEFNLMPQVGEWIVARSDDYVAFGYVSTVTTGFEVTHTVRTSQVRVSCISWFELLQRTQVYVAYGYQGDDTGTLFAPKWWSLVLDVIGEGVTTSLGDALSLIFKRIARVNLPASLSGLALGYAVKIAHDDVTRRQFCPNRPIESVPGRQIATLNHLNPQGTTVGGVLSAFIGDSQLVEMFPSLEEPGVPPEQDPLEGKVFISGDSVKLLEGTTVIDAPAPFSYSGSPKSKQTAKKTPKPATKLGLILGKNPVLVYRMKPLRGIPLSEAVLNPSFLGSLFPGVTFPPPTYIHPDKIKSIQIRWDDQNRVNAVTCDLPMASDTPIRWMEKAGLPIESISRIRNYGLRLNQPSWPFFADPQEADQIKSIYSIAAQALTVTGLGERFFSGTAQLTQVDIMPGTSVQMCSEDFWTGPMTAYVESTTRNWSAEGNMLILGNGSIEFSRGLLDENERKIREV